MRQWVERKQGIPEVSLQVLLHYSGILQFACAGFFHPRVFGDLVSWSLRYGPRSQGRWRKFLCYSFQCSYPMMRVRNWERILGQVESPWPENRSHLEGHAIELIVCKA